MSITKTQMTRSEPAAVVRGIMKINEYGDTVFVFGIYISQFKAQMGWVGIESRSYGHPGDFLDVAWELGIRELHIACEVPAAEMEVLQQAANRKGFTIVQGDYA